MWEMREIQEIPLIESTVEQAICIAPSASVLLLTRNHAEYIEEAVKSILMQETSFPYEILIGDDCSSDGTSEICRSLHESYPDKIRLVLSPERVGITRNFLRLAIRARAPFIALLEGDDYWTSADKLDKQITFLQNNHDCSWCGAKTLNRIHPYPSKERYSLREVCRRFVVHTSTIAFRRESLFPYPYFPDIVGWISMVCVVLSTRGKCGFMNENLSYYRRHSGGLYTGADRNTRIKLAQAFTDIINNFLKGEYSSDLYSRELWICDWEMSLHPHTFSLSKWASGLISFLKIEGGRGLANKPISFLFLFLGVLIQPIRSFYFNIRTK